MWVGLLRILTLMVDRCTRFSRYIIKSKHACTPILHTTTGKYKQTFKTGVRDTDKTYFRILVIISCYDFENFYC